MGTAWRTAGWILLGASLILALSLGIRHGFGLFLAPMSSDFGWGREVFAFAIALQNLIWGLAQPFTGAVADRFGASRVIVLGGLLYAAGLALMALSDTPWSLSLSAGVLIGIGLSGTSFSVLLGVVGRALPPEQRSLGMGIAAAAGSFGQFIMLPGSLGLISLLGWSAALLALGLLVALIAPLALLVRDRPQPVSSGSEQSLGQALREAAGHSGFWLLALGFFVCGFQVVFIGAHLPSYVLDKGLPANVGMLALALIGLFNIFGTYGFGQMGGRWSKKKLLAVIYLARSAVIVAFLAAPLSSWSVGIFAAAMGFLWLGTVPLTNGLVAQIFGVKYLAMLSGFVFFSHQLGSFLGVWLGGFIFDRTGAYDIVWIISIALGVLAALVNLPVDERPLARLSSQPAR